MRLLHTSDWHLGRSLHRADLRAAQSAFLDHLVDVARAEKVDAVLVAGDVYDRAVPPVDAVELCEDALLRLHDTGARIVLISGNHDSARGSGSAAGCWRRRACTCAPGPARWPGRSSSRTPTGRWPCTGCRTWSRTRSAASCPRARTRSPAGTPGCSGTRSPASAPTPTPAGSARRVVMAHGWVSGGAASESERDISVGGVGQVPAELFAGFGYVALGHLHGQQTVAPHLRYSGSPLPYSFSEASHRKGSWLVDLDDAGAARVEQVPAPVYRRLSVLRGRLADLLGSAAYEPVRGRLRVRHAHRPEPPRGSDGRPARPLPARPRARVRAGGRACPTSAATGPGPRAATTCPSPPSSSGTSATRLPPRARKGCSPARSPPSGPLKRKRRRADAPAPAARDRVRRVRRHGGGQLRRPGQLGTVPAARRDGRGQDHAAGRHRVRPVRPGARRARQGQAAALGSRRAGHPDRGPARGDARRPADADHPEAGTGTRQAPRGRHHHRAGEGPARGAQPAAPGAPSPPGWARPTPRSPT